MRSLSTLNLATKIAIVGIATIVGIGVFSLTKKNLVYMMQVIDVTSANAQTVEIPAAGSPPSLSSPAGAANRPFIRVGLFTTEDIVKVKTTLRSQIITTDGTAHYTVKKNSLIKLQYDRDTGEYTVRNGSWKLTTALPARIVPVKPGSIATIINYENRPTWDLTLNDNEFYGVIELQYASATDSIWVINELGVENYLQGIGEAGNENDLDYLKALLTAARSYVYYHYLHPTKHADEPYLVDATPNDQVYLGYGFTKRAPNIAEAVQQTRGRIVEYDGVPVVTPYFSRSDGRTRSWSEVWAGEQSYLQSVADPCCTGETLLGHGVGMSAEGARYFAEDYDWDWKKILKYYYTGVTVKELWK